jgi:hypothetical protein
MIRRPKIAVLEYRGSEDSLTSPPNVILLQNLENLRTNNEPNLQRCIIIQLPRYAKHNDHGLRPNREAVQTLIDGLSKLGMPAEAIVMDHIKEESNPFRFIETFTTPERPSELNPAESFTVTSYEIVSYDGSWSEEISHKFRNDTTGEFELSCADTGHQVQLHEWHNKQRSPLFIVPRNCSFWCKRGPSGSSDGTFHSIMRSQLLNFTSRHAH